MSPAARPLDVIVPVYRNAELTRRCIESVCAHLGEIAERRPRVILIDDSPDDAEVTSLLDGLARDRTQFLLLRNEVNSGFVVSVNRGLVRALQDRHDVLLINSDTFTFSGTLSEILDAANSDPLVGFVSPRSNNASICTLPHDSRNAALSLDEARRRWLLVGRTLPRFHFVPTAVGFYMFISHLVLANVGLLNEEFGAGYEEENDLVMRAGKLGYRAVLANRAFAFHAGAASFALAGVDLDGHRHDNLERLHRLHPEFVPLVRRYERSPHFRAEALLSGLLPDQDGRVRVAFDLTGMGQHHNGTNEQTVAVLRRLPVRHRSRLRVSAICTPLSFEFHGLHEVPGLYREDPGAPGLHGVAVRLAQPFLLEHLQRLETLAPLNVFAMLDTIAEDCGPLAVRADVRTCWDHVAEHADGLVFISEFSRRTFCARHPAARQRAQLTRLLPTRLSSYGGPTSPSGRRHVLVLGNHFAHKGADAAAVTLAAAYPNIDFLVFGANDFEQGNLRSVVPGVLEPALVKQSFDDASVVVLPSHVEGFGFGFMHALAAGRPIVARRIAATEEILQSLDRTDGVFLFDDDTQLLSTFDSARAVTSSHADDSRAEGWDEWVDALAGFILDVARCEALFGHVTRRLNASDRLATCVDDSPSEVGELAPRRAASGQAYAAPDVSSLLALDGEAFVDCAYMTLLRRPADHAGREFYMGQLGDGVNKASIVRALAISSEGRARNVVLDGLPALLSAGRNPLLGLAKSLLRLRAQP